MPDRPISRDDVSSAVGARRELGEDLEPEVIDAFLDRVERAIDTRVDERLAGRRGGRAKGDEDRTVLTLAIVSLGTGIPITAIAGALGGLPGILIVWIGIVALNVAYSRRPS